MARDLGLVGVGIAVGEEEGGGGLEGEIVRALEAIINIDSGRNLHWLLFGRFVVCGGGGDNDNDNVNDNDDNNTNNTNNTNRHVKIARLASEAASAEGECIECNLVNKILKTKTYVSTASILQSSRWQVKLQTTLLSIIVLSRISPESLLNFDVLSARNFVQQAKSGNTSYPALHLEELVTMACTVSTASSGGEEVSEREASRE